MVSSGPHLPLGALALTLLLTFATPRVTSAQPVTPGDAGRDSVRLERSVMIPMRDGTRLALDLYFPVDATGPLPVILSRTPYGKNTPGYNRFGRLFAPHGYAVAIQDLRGRYESEGRFTAWSGVERNDGYDTVDWLSKQSWSTGKIGTIGCSYGGEVQLKLAAARHPAHAAAITQGSGAAYGGTGLQAGGLVARGVFEMAASFGWSRWTGQKVFWRAPVGMSREEYLKNVDYFSGVPTTPPIDDAAILRTLPVYRQMEKAQAPPNDYQDWPAHAPWDKWWNFEQLVTAADSFNVATLHIDSWFDPVPDEQLILFNLMRNNATAERGRNRYAIIAPTGHCTFERATEHTVVGDRDFGDARLDWTAIYLSWFDRWLKEKQDAIATLPRLQLYLMGKNEWRAEREWPLARTQFTKYYLHSAGRANSRFGDGTLSTQAPRNEPADVFTYDPATPAPTTGGSICGACTGTLKSKEGAVDQSELEMRNDVLVYTGVPLVEGLEVTGPLEASITLSSSAKDTDVNVKLVDVAPDGTAWYVQEGVARARYRMGLDAARLMEPGKTYSIVVRMQATSHWFAPGHRIRVEVTSSSFPRFDRNLGTGGNGYDETTWVVARNVVHHSAKALSYVTLPVIPAKVPAAGSGGR
ncbi:MAG: CocE/NonD family hydrolase [Gemmatimonadaceae bacterium]|nr:CocE/NonD family hydrolase [Gemmatimonadaceae bacterium]